MKLNELKLLAAEGKLRIEKRKWRIVYRSKGWRGQKWDDTTKVNWDNTQIPYQTYHYEARTPEMPEHQCFIITKKDFQELEEIIKNL
mgnify:FL=1